MMLSFAKGVLTTAMVVIGLSTISAGPSAAQNTLKIAAVVNDDVITVYDLSARIDLVVISANMPATAETKNRLAPQVLRGLINERLQVQEAKAIGAQVSEEELDNALSKIEARNRMAKGTLQKSLEAKGVDYLSLREQITAALSWVKVKQRLARREVSISEDEVEAVIKRMEANQGKPERRVAEIFLPVDSPDQEAVVQNRARQIVADLRSGVKFRALAQQFSQGPSASRGGDLGWLRPGQLSTEFETALERLAKGSISDPIRDTSGYHILTIIAERASEAAPVTEEKVQLYQVVVPISPVIGTTEKAVVKAASDKIANNAASCADMAKFGMQTGSPLSGNLGTLKQKDLAPGLRKIVAPLPLRKASAALNTTDGLMYVMVCRRTGGANTSLAAMRMRINRMLLEKRVESMAQKRLIDLRQSAILDIRL